MDPTVEHLKALWAEVDVAVGAGCARSGAPPVVVQPTSITLSPPVALGAPRGTAALAPLGSAAARARAALWRWSSSLARRAAAALGRALLRFARWSALAVRRAVTRHPRPALAVLVFAFVSLASACVALAR